jgi:hypothetical protein
LVRDHLGRLQAGQGSLVAGQVVEDLQGGVALLVCFDSRRPEPRYGFSGFGFELGSTATAHFTRVDSG